MNQAHTTRPSAIAGSWYPGSERPLRAVIQEFLDQANPPALAGKLLGLVVPHAGYQYSGQTAAFAFKLLAGLSFEQVILTSPFHAFARDAFLTTQHDAYETPLGSVPVDHASLDQLDAKLKAAGFPGITKIRREQEHSLEIELPFLQFMLNQPFQLIPLMIRTHSSNALQQLGMLLAQMANEKNTLLVASTDLSHFNQASAAEKMDRRALDNIASLNAEKLLIDNECGAAPACGAGAVAAMLYAAKELGADNAHILRYSHSGHVTGDLTSVVGYGAAAVVLP
jgi:MEMO1 family protein